jgi:hypothetical protein
MLRELSRIASQLWKIVRLAGADSTFAAITDLDQ